LFRLRFQWKKVKTILDYKTIVTLCTSTIKTKLDEIFYHRDHIVSRRFLCVEMITVDVVIIPHSRKWVTIYSPNNYHGHFWCDYISAIMNPGSIIPLLLPTVITR
jgi:hypothetical protein